MGTNPDGRAGLDHFHEGHGDVEVAEVGEGDVCGDYEAEQDDAEDG